ncbi:MAG: response regulator [Candidatus Coatesbacteria bacterium]|nr:MAG: response regulator [Candidatus Coatesbacteria bacterium]
MSKPLALVADDDIGVREAFREFLAAEDLEVEEACDGAAAIKLVEAADPDLAFLDVHIPVFDGLSVLKMAKDIKPDLYVIMMSGEPSTGMMADAIASGAYTFLVKPFDFEYLARVVEEIMSRGLPEELAGKKFSVFVTNGLKDVNKGKEEDTSDEGGQERMAIVRWSPFRDILAVQNEMNRIFDDLMTRRREEGDVEGGVWAPFLDISETKDEIVVKAEIPGVEKDDIKLSITDNILVLKGEKKMSREVEEENYHRIERVYGSFYRSVELPSRVKADGIEAKFEKGVLEIRIPKAEEAKVKEIEIKLPE